MAIDGHICYLDYIFTKTIDNFDIYTTTAEKDHSQFNMI